MNKEELLKEIEHIANCELYDTIGVKYLKLNIEKLFEENKQLKERVDYLERSNNRREDEIISLRQELIDKEENIDSAIEYIENTPTIYSSEKKTCKDLLRILKGEEND